MEEIDRCHRGFSKEKKVIIMTFIRHCEVL